jgi:hypothetical protein
MTRPINPSFSYYGSEAGHIADQAVSRLQTAFDRIGAAIRSIGNAVRSASYGLRQEVPFERWFFNHGFEKPIECSCDLLKAHAWAVLSTGEGSVRMCIETVAYLFSLVFEPGESPRHLDVLKAQAQGVALSLHAMFSPNGAKAAAHNSGHPIIGCSIFNWKWGTLYTGKLDVPLWHVECKQYPWVDRPAQ